jgi:hypothetical protein
MIFGFNKIAMSDLKVENEDLKRKIALLEAEISTKTFNLLDEVNKGRDEAEFEIDFKTMRVFSIERGTCNNQPATVFGYYMEEPVISSDGEMIKMRDVVCEWTFYCSIKRHNEIVEKFRAHNASK